ncbi:hypothetical protein [Bacillus changyiensis]|uniref:hypothetical protein n=1 Tax=Bacillus changyiensis TaxID=3004103 RepID=UPI0022DEEB10|nr:hypothetical protein [Bacillus changyiensis]MDA1477056.1 hypothetical protein [Bacillus changyiensis]
MKKLLITFCVAVPLVFTGVTNLKAAESPNSETINYILKMNPGLTKGELMNSAKQAAKQSKKSTEQVLNEVKSELKKQENLTRNEEAKSITFSAAGSSSSSSGSKKQIGTSSKGNIFYTPAATIGVQHGHVGMYYTSNTIVESVKGGVRAIKTNRVFVERNAVVKSVKVSKNKKYNSVNWGKSRVGKDGYSGNFVTNRITSHYGAKNCSKLVWSAFKMKAGIDMDKNKGYGVYPKDIRDSSYTKFVRRVD